MLSPSFMAASFAWRSISGAGGVAAPQRRRHAKRGGGAAILGGVDYVVIPAGCFWMGWEQGHPAERPRHRVWVGEFAIARWPVTNAEYRAYVEATGASPPPWWSDPR